MAKRSLQASSEGARLARKAFERKGWTQENLAAELELKTRQPIWRFFTCRPIERHIFIEVCHILDLNWWEVAEHPPEFLLETATAKEQQEPSFLPPAPQVKASGDQLVQQVRGSCRNWIENQCGFLRIPGTRSPASFDALYVPVDLVQPRAVPVRQLVENLQAKFHSNLQAGASGSIRLLEEKRSDDAEGGVRGPATQLMQQHTKLRILGKPGSGKTALLKYLALESIRGAFAADKLPLLINLDSFAAYCQKSGQCSLLDYICYELSGCGISDSETVTTLLSDGYFLLLLDALDEVPEPDKFAIYKEVSRFTERYYHNQVVMTARLACDRFEFSQFVDVEIGSLTDEQVTALSGRWFKLFSETAEPEGQLYSARFLRQLRLPENQSIAALARIPLLFHTIAQLFLTRGELTANHLEIYETCLDLLFERWDRARGINPSPSEADLPVAVKQAVLMQLAAIGFEQQRCWFKRHEVINWIEAHLEQLYPNVLTSGTQTMGKTIFAALERDHGLLVEQAQGVFSFSSPGFQNYFTAQWIARWVASSEHSDCAIASLTPYATDSRWREVILLSCALTADEQLPGVVNQALDRLISEHSELFSFINWTQQIPLKSSIYQQIRTGFLLWRIIIRTPALLIAYGSALLVLHTLAQQLLFEVMLDRLFKNILLFQPGDAFRLEKIAMLLGRAIALSSRSGYEIELQALQAIRRELPDLSQAMQLPAEWEANQTNWAHQMRQVLADWYEDDRYRSLTEAQEQGLKHHVYLSKLLAECLSVRSNPPRHLSSNLFGMGGACPACLKTASASLRKPHRPMLRAKTQFFSG